MLGTMMPGDLLSLPIEGQWYNSPRLLLKRHPYGGITVRFDRRCLRDCNIIYLIRSSFPVIFLPLCCT